MSLKSERKARIKAEKQAAHGFVSAWQQFKDTVIRHFSPKGGRHVIGGVDAAQREEADDKPSIIH